MHYALLLCCMLSLHLRVVMRWSVITVRRILTPILELAMNSTRGRRKRKAIDNAETVTEKKLTKYNGTNGVNGDNEMVDYPPKNGDSSVEGKALQSFHAKFAKCKGETIVHSNTSKTGKCACFVCKINGDLIKCSIESCDKHYHSKCLEKLPSLKSEPNACPLHLCLTCYNINPKNPQISKGQMYKCFKCPTAFHSKDECNIPGSVILTHEVMSCPDHFSPERQREYPAVMNLLFCVQCGCNEDLIFCSFCPTAIHKSCIKGGTFVDDKFLCNRCESRKILCFHDIVWAKVCNFRWWPARILNPKEVPLDVQKMKHFEGEFPIQFFETEEYFWTQKGRVFPFFYKEIGVEDDQYMKHNFKKQTVDTVFDKAVDLALKAVEDKKVVKLVEPINNKKPPPYKHIKSNRPIGNVQIYTAHDISDYTACGCQPEDPNPCGYGTLCLNRSMCTECNGDICEAGNSCQNQKIQKREDAAIKPFYTSNRGWGLKCLEDIKKGHFVVEYIGDLIDEEECARRIEQKQACGDTNFYFCTLDSNRIIDAGPKGNYSRFLNHSCDPNCETQKWIVNGDARVGIFAKKDIPSGSELTFDYQMDFSHYEKLKCNCGSDRCSGLIGKKPQKGLLTTNILSNVKAKNDTAKLTLKVENGVKKDKVLCFKCKKGGKLIKCSHELCGKSFHIRCMGPKLDTKRAGSSDWKCPCHFCRKCKGSPDYQCFFCYNAYCKKHAGDISKSKQFACPRHVKHI